MQPTDVAISDLVRYCPDRFFHFFLMLIYLFVVGVVGPVQPFT